ncbi:MAG: bacteriophage abortive infection AbiH family protein [Oscillospiraceae bacterium]|jgi:hypothetical protein|nr:bacteriophage abortive infection AbiH family protein [Oscillospiraceae bacterium]
MRQGLKTSYRDFYQSKYVRENKETNMIYQAIEKDYNTWSDFEYALGDLSKAPKTKERREQFFGAICDAYEDLQEYLKYASRRMPSIKYSLPLELGQYLSRGSRENFEAWLRGSLNESSRIHIDVATFNYTDASDFPKIGNSIRAAGRNIPVVEANFFQLHGTLANFIIVGCDNATQYSAECFSSQNEYLISKDIVCSDADVRSARKEVLLRMTDCQLMVIFGSSLGKTDQTYWRTILVRLTDPSVRLFIFDF